MKRAVNSQMPVAKRMDPQARPSGIPWMKPIQFNQVPNKASNNPGPGTAPSRQGPVQPRAVQAKQRPV